VREIFSIAAEAGSLQAAQKEVRTRGITTKQWRSVLCSPMCSTIVVPRFQTSQ
jgi:hypothetical protein